jgi:hypothetical protein
MNEYKCNKCNDKGYINYEEIGETHGWSERCRCSPMKKSNWLQFNGSTVRKASIFSYTKKENSVIIHTNFWLSEDFHTEEEAQARFDEIDKEIRL